MLSRFLSAARSILTPQRPTEESTLDEEAISETEQEMVRTRRQSGNSAAFGGDRTSSPLEDEIPKELLTGESRKRRLQIEKENGGSEGPTPRSASKRQKKAVNGANNEQTTETHTHFEKDMTVASLVGNDEAAEIEPETTVNEDLTSREPAKKKKPAPKKSPKTKKSSGKTVEEQPDAMAQRPAAKPKHKKFGSEEPEEQLIPEPETRNEVEDSEEDSSDDDAPEEVTTNAAEEKARKVAQDASKAAELQEAKLRKKRKEKDEKLKKQAKPSSKGQELETGSDEDEESAAVVEKPKLDRRNLPAFLPEEYLSDTEDVPNLPLSKHIKGPQRPKKIKFPDEKKPKDMRIGSTTFRVADQNKDTAVLAPKVNKVTRNIKESWLQRKTLQGGGVRKKPSSGGFFVKK